MNGSAGSCRQAGDLDLQHILPQSALEATGKLPGSCRYAALPCAFTRTVAVTASTYADGSNPGPDDKEEVFEQTVRLTQFT